VERHAHAFPGARHLTLGFDGTDGTVSDLSGFTALGLTAEAQTVMTARRVRCNDGADPVLHLRFAEARAQTHRRLVAAGHGGWFGAFVDGRLACQMGLFAASPGLARFQSVETDPDFRRRGIARALVQHVSRYGFEQLGAHTLVMVADPEYFAIDLYRSVGFESTQAQLQAERLPQVADSGPTEQDRTP
jgi:GNAT superfamily N-acetyltransferase